MNHTSQNPFGIGLIYLKKIKWSWVIWGFTDLGSGNDKGDQPSGGETTWTNTGGIQSGKTG